MQMKSQSSLRSRFTRPVFLWALAALVAEVAVQWATQHGHPPAARLLTLLPLAPMLLFLVALVHAILRMDELQKRICLESLSMAFVLTLLLTLIFIALERAELYHAKWNDLGTYMMALWAVAYVFSARRYR